ncbi:sulfatase and phosphatidylinositolglycan class N domain-containing protein [Actinidia rufa]|uniref:GPI ethanolamine phosphate transferase 1 n=1 Tax=Actinidia rufa TaxID=165716 RepID=A0A7J0DZ30_9ERIC|nr:sulfatase and phosphatidylinositolglycan class N domain-containing protein [Actinidia rufa]
MGGSDGILGVAEIKSATSMEKRGKWLKRRERWLVVLGVVLHAVYMLSIFDIYFKTPIVHGMDPVPPRFTAPAKRLVLLISDGLRADKFFEPDTEGNYRAPFLRSVIKGWGRWGVSHARPPTESRPGHVSIIAGFYEDPSAVTKGWKANPVEFDSVFNRSRHTFAFGSPDIIPIFCSALPHSTWNSYPHEFEDFATDASFLDEWSFDQFQSLLNRSSEDPKLKQLLLQDNLVIFLHLLGCDSNGHAHRPYSSIYLNNVKVVDRIAESVYHLVESYFMDNRTAYIFTADHGMSDKGSHGDGHQSNTDTPLVAWGAGVRHPMPMSSNNHSDCGVRFIDEHMHDMPTPTEWGLGGIERVDVNQADIAPLMSTLLGLPCPVNSVGNLPLGYVNLNEAEEVEAVLANTKQILNQYLRKSFLDQVEYLISIRDYEAAMKLSQNLRSLALKGLNYFQTYDWLMLMTVVTLGYIGWMIYLILHVLQSYTSFAGKEQQVLHLRNSTAKVHLCGYLFMGFVCILLLLEHSPPLYHAYAAMTVFLWSQIFSEYQFLKALWRDLLGKQSSCIIRLVATFAISVVILEFLVHSFTERKLYTWCFLIVGVIASSHLYYSIPWKSVIPIFVWFSCWFLSVFTLMPAEIPDNTLLVFLDGSPTVFSNGHLVPNDFNISWFCTHVLTSINWMVLFNVAFFGTGNFASIASFEISSVYRFITIFSPFLMAGLLIFKLFIPFMLVMFTSGLELANVVVNSDLLHHSWAAIEELYRETNLNDLTSTFSIKYKVYEQPQKATVIAFVSSPHCTAHHLQGQGGRDSVSSVTLREDFPVFEFVGTKVNPAFSIHRAAATLFASLKDDLSSLKDQDTKRPLCITFGSPLLGDNGLQQAILERPTWNSCFLHVASNQDPIPKLFASPHNALAIESTSHASIYKPFGTILLCSKSGCACFEDPESTLDLMLEEWNVSPLQTGIFLQIEAIKVERTLQRHENGGINSLIPTIERRTKDHVAYKRKVFDPMKTLKGIQLNIIPYYMPWLVKVSKSRGGYYDVFKTAESRWREEIVKRKNILAQYGAFFIARWLYGGTNYRRFVEPLDIAEFYKKGKKDYLAGRSEHYKLLEQWVKDEKPEGRQSNTDKRSRACSLTEDSCFWAHVEEAIVWCKSLEDGETGPEDKELLTKNLVEFENYAMDLIRNYGASTEIFLGQSSFMKWWENYEMLKGTSYHSSLTDFMRDRRYEQYA